MSKVTWEKVPVSIGLFGGMCGGNHLLSGDGWYISYQDFSEGGRVEVIESLNETLTGDTRRGDETALYDGKTWRILWGDHRKDYETVFGEGLEACIAVYDSLKPEYGCDKWSTDED